MAPAVLFLYKQFLLPKDYEIVEGLCWFSHWIQYGIIRKKQLFLCCHSFQENEMDMFEFLYSEAVQ